MTTNQHTGPRLNPVSGDHYLEDEFHALMATDKRVREFLSAGCLDGIWYWDLLEPEHEWMSASFWQTLGYDPSSKPHLSASWQDIIWSEDLELAVENANRHYADPNYPYDQIVRYRHASGSTVWVRCRGMAIRNEDGAPVRMLGAHTDVTQLKRVEEELRARSRELDLIITHVPARIWLTDENSVVLRCNKSAARLSGSEEEGALENVPISSLPEYAQQMLSGRGEASDQGRVGEVARVVDATGRDTWLSVDRIPLDDAGSSKWLTIGTDVTAAVVRERELGLVNANLRDFAHMAAHDLRAPIRQIGVFAEILEEEQAASEATSEESRDALTQILRSVRRAHAVLDGIRQLSQLENEPVHSLVSLESVVREAQLAVSEELRTSGALVSCDPLPTVMGAHDLLVQLFMNLLSNAVKYAGDDAPRVRVWSRNTANSFGAPGGTLVCVEDDGVGIPPSHHERVFGSFERLDGSVEGAGLGLSICRRVAELHGATITIDPKKTAGTRFVLEFPSVGAL